MNAFSTAEKNAQLDNFATRALFGSLHSAYPGDTGANELAIVRQAMTPWNAAASGILTSAGSPVFTAVTGTIAWLGFWSLAVAGTFRGAIPLTGSVASEPLPFQGEAATNLITADNHGLSIGETVTVFEALGAVLPSGLTEGGIFFLIADSFTADTFKLSLTSGGAEIDIGDGAGHAQRIVTETFGAPGTYSPSAISVSANR